MAGKTSFFGGKVWQTGKPNSRIPILKWPYIQKYEKSQILYSGNVLVAIGPDNPKF
tara:strand:- start:158 stop:325 length:168 start_codon:yes stop_codon:yes gene_type:complete